MLTRHGQAHWEGGLRQGSGRIRLGNGAFDAPYSFSSRFEEQPGSNPEELIGAAHAACFSMALAGVLEKAGHAPARIDTSARVALRPESGGFMIGRVELTTEGKVPGLEEDAFRKAAEQAKRNCPVSKALAGVEIRVKATLLS